MADDKTPKPFMTLQDIEDFKKSLVDNVKNRVYTDTYMAQQTLEALKEWHKFQEQRKETVERRIKTMKQTGVVLQNKQSGVKWTVIGTKITKIPDSYGLGIKDKTIEYVKIQSENSGMIKEIHPRLKEGRYAIVHVPDAAKVLYGLKEDEENN